MKLLEHPRVAQTRRDLDLLLGNGAISEYSNLRFEDGEVRYCMKLVKKMSFLYSNHRYEVRK